MGDLGVHTGAFVKVNQTEQHRQFILPALKIHRYGTGYGEGINAAVGLDVSPFQITAATFDAPWFRVEVDGVAMAAFLHDQPAFFRGAPEWSCQVGDFRQWLIRNIGHRLNLRSENERNTAATRTAVRDAPETTNTADGGACDLALTGLATQLCDRLDQGHEPAIGAARLATG
jgi:hypothetical protein